MAEREFVHVSEAYTEIGGQKFDLIHVDFAREHPEPDLVRMRRFDPAGLVVRTDEQAAEFLTNYVDNHLKVCVDGCREINNEDFKSY